LEGSLSDLFLVKLIFEILKNKLFFDDLVDLGLDFLDFWDIRGGSLERIEYTSLYACELQLLQVVLFVLNF
jgi:hypothetical protein